MKGIRRFFLPIHSLVSGLDPDAAALDDDALAYISAVETAKGSSVTSVQQEAINNFFVKGWVSSGVLKRGFLTIWANASADSVEFTGVGSVAWTNITHSAGYITGASGYGAMGEKVSEVADIEDAAFLTIAYTTMAVNTASFGTGGFSTTGMNVASRNSPAGNRLVVEWAGVKSPVLNSMVGNGILVGTRTGGTTYASRLSPGSGWQEESTTGAIGSPADGDILFLSVTTISSFATHRSGGFFVTEGLDATQREDLANDLKTLWEACTGLSLP